MQSVKVDNFNQNDNDNSHNDSNNITNTNENKTINDGGITVDFSIIKVYTSN